MTGLAADKNYTELSQPELSITWVKFKIQCTSELHYSLEIFFEPQKCTNRIAATMQKFEFIIITKTI